MKRGKKLLSLLLVLAMMISVLAVPGFTGAAEGTSDAVITGLQTDYMENPIGTDETEPSFSWKMQSETRGQQQTAYEVMVATSAEKLAAGDYDMWDSGKVESGTAVGIAYEGEELQPTTRYYWQVKVWDKDGNVSFSEEEAYFETGLMGTGWEDAQWIQLGDGSTGEPEESDSKKFSISVDFKIENAVFGLIFGAKDSANFYMWQVNANGEGTPFLKPHQWVNNNAAAFGEQPELTEVLPTKESAIGSVHNMTLYVDNGLVETYIDNVLVDTRTIDAVEVGYVGARAYEGNTEDERFYIDNLVVKDSKGTVTFSDDFSDASNPNFTGGEVVDGMLYLNHSGIVLQKPDLSGPMYTVEADFEIENTAFGLIFGAKDTNNFYMWQVNATKSADDIVLLRPHQFVNGTGNLLADVALPTDLFANKAAAIGSQNHLKLEIGNKVVRTYINNVLVDTRAVDITEPGHVGLRAYLGDPENERYFADNIIVKDPEGTVLFSEDFSNEEECAFDGGEIIDGRLYLTDGVLIEGVGSSAPMLRKEFSTGGREVKSARLYATAAGIYYLYLNGQAVSEDCFNPGWTDFYTRIRYQTYDVTDMIQSGNNAIAAELGLGWYAGRGLAGTYGASAPALLAKLVVEYTDGTREVIATDSSWQSTANGPIKMNDFFLGETYDARLEMPGWKEVGFNDSEWLPAKETTKEALNLGEITAQIAPQVRQMETVSPISVTEPVPGNFVYDFGQNLVGVAQIHVTGNAGDTITMRHGEMLNDAPAGERGCDGPVGTIYTAAYRTAKCTVNYTLKGDPNGETYAPSMFYTGFRYLEITGIDEPLPLEDVKALVLYSGMEVTSTFESSNPLVNQIYSNTVWSQKGNFLAIPTDCPQRDERYGWTGDIQVFARTSSYNMNDAAFLYSYMQSVNDAQRENGAYGDVAPTQGWQNGTGGWAEAGVIVPWQMYQQFGDINILRDFYDNMVKFIEFEVSAAGDDWLKEGGWTGDWLATDKCSTQLTDTAYCIYACDLMAKIADILGKPEDAATFQTYANNFRNAWCNQFVTEEGTLTSDGNNNTQTAYAMALQFNIIPDELRESFANQLVEKIKANGYRLSTGFLGVSYLNPVLTDSGHGDVAFRLLEQTEYPSWIYPILQGATTIWERWNSYTKESGFGDVSMNSFNHYSYGAVCEWIYKDMLGIERDESSPETVAYKHFYLEPTFGGTLTYAKGSFESQYGEIQSGWQLGEDDLFIYDATVPANTTATLILPVNKSGTVITESGIPAEEAEGVQFIKTEGNKVYYELQSGTYHFEMTTDPNTTRNYTVTIENPDGVDAKAVVDGKEYVLPATFTVFGGEKSIEIVSNDPHYTYSHVMGDLFSTGKPLDVYLDGNLSLDARFMYVGDNSAQDKATLTLTGPEGSCVWINGWQELLPYSDTFNKGEQLEITVDTPGDGNTFVEWSGGMLKGSPAYVVMNSDVTAEMVTEIPQANRNVALGAIPSTNSTEELPEYGWTINALNDGVKEGVGWTSAKLTGSDLSASPVWVELDLGQDTYFDEMVLYPRSDGDAHNVNRAAFPQDFTISVKEDGSDEYKVVKEMTGCADVLDPLTVDFEGVSARYVRITVTKASEQAAPNDSSYRVQFAEVELYNSYSRDEAQMVWGVDVTADQKTIQVGESINLSAVVSPAYVDNQAVVWYLSNDNRAPADQAILEIDGNRAVLTGVAEGEFYVYAEAADGGGAYGFVDITVVPNDKPPVIEEPVRAPEVVTVDTEFEMTVVTPSDVEDFDLFGEKDLRVAKTVNSVTTDENGNKVWNISLRVGTIGLNRTLRIYTKTASDAPYEYYTEFNMRVNPFAPESVTVDETFDITFQIPKGATAYMENEYGLRMGIRLKESAESTDGNQMNTYEMSIGTAGEKRTYDVYVKLATGEVEWLGDFEIDVTPKKPEIKSAEIEGTGVVNKPVKLKVVTNSAVNKIVVKNENGMAMGILSQSYEETAEGREWTDRKSVV